MAELQDEEFAVKEGYHLGKLSIMLQNGKNGFQLQLLTLSVKPATVG
jgi:hypothetical protein